MEQSDIPIGPTQEARHRDSNSSASANSTRRRRKKKKEEAKAAENRFSILDSRFSIENPTSQLERVI
jgi:hypothetical protein